MDKKNSKIERDDRAFVSKQVRKGKISFDYLRMVMTRECQMNLKYLQM